jgi:hypothetical protein
MLERNPDLILHHMHDPNQDRLTLRRMAYFRVKQTALGPAYRRFLTECLEPGATIVMAECGLRWPVTRIAARHVFQFGAVGGLPPQEYVTGSDRITAYLRRYRAGRDRWEPPAADDDAPEAEWGFEAALRADITAFAAEHGFRVRRLVYDEPEDLSPVVADLYRWWYRQHGLSADRLFVDSFMLLDPWWTWRTATVPYWSVFPVQPSLAALHDYLDHAEPFDRIDLALFCHGVESAGVTTRQQWDELLQRARRTGAYAGVSPRRYPLDPRTFFDFQQPLRAAPRQRRLPPMTLDAVASFLDENAGRYPRLHTTAFA